jgi:hypothetical protein
MNEKNEPIPLRDTDSATDWETLDSQVSTAIEEIESALEEALTATRNLSKWVEGLRTLSVFMKQVESGLVEVRHRLGVPPESGRPAPVPSVEPSLEAVAEEEPGPLESVAAEPEAGGERQPAAVETAEAEGAPEPPKSEGGIEPAEAAAVTEGEQPPASEGGAEPAEAAVVTEGEQPPASEGGAEPAEAAVVAEGEQPPASEGGAEPAEAVATEGEQPPEPAEGESMEAAPSVAEGGDSIRLEIESSEANIDLMVVERALRETPGVADVDLLDYAGKRARVQVTLKPGERPQEVANPERLAASVRERLAKLAWDGSLSVSAPE